MISQTSRLVPTRSGDRHLQDGRPAAVPTSANELRATTEAFWAATGNVTAAASLVTTFAAGQAYGTTVTAFMSLSIDPPTILISLDNKSTLSKIQLDRLYGVEHLTLVKQRTDPDNRPTGLYEKAVKHR